MFFHQMMNQTHDLVKKERRERKMFSAIWPENNLRYRQIDKLFIWLHDKMCACALDKYFLRTYEFLATLIGKSLVFLRKDDYSLFMDFSFFSMKTINN